MNVCEVEKELQQFLTAKVGRQPDPHPLMGFFTIRDIKQLKIAKWCGTSPAYISMMLNGIRYTPDPINEKLYDLRDRIRASEKRTGKMFNVGGPAPQED